LLDQLNTTTQDSYLHFARIPSHDEEESYFSIPLAEEYAIIEAEATTTTATTIQFPVPAEESTSPASEKENTIFVGEMLLSNLTDADADDDDDDDEEVLLSNVSSEEAPSIAIAEDQAVQWRRFGGDSDIFAATNVESQASSSPAVEEPHKQQGSSRRTRTHMEQSTQTERPTTTEQTT
jgi:hypothetical protein